MSSPTTTTHLIQILSISTALFASGSIASLSAFSIPLMRSQPSSRSLPMLRWLFSRGSHTAPPAILASSSGFLYLAYTSLPASARSARSILAHALHGKPGTFLAASVLCFSCALFTSVAMIPLNFELIRRNELLGGSHSAESAEYRDGINAAPRTAEESVDGKEDLSQWTDTSGPQTKTQKEASGKEDEAVKVLLGRFGRLNYVRAGLIGAGGVVGLVSALM